MSKPKIDLSVNFETVFCPKCKTKQPQIRIPKNLREALWGGYTCKNCGCKMNKHGEERK